MLRTIIPDADVPGRAYGRVMHELSDANLRGADIRDADFREAWFREPDLENAHIRGADLTSAEIDGEIEGMSVNGVEIAPLIEAELDRRHPERVVLRAHDADAFRTGWAGLETMWQQTMDRVAAMPAGTSDMSVSGEWSFAETLRHLVFATDVWLNDGILRETESYHPAGVPFSGWRDRAGEVGIDVEARPPYDEVVQIRAGRVAAVRDFLGSLTDDVLDEEDRRPHFVSQDFSVRTCLWIVANEEWQHHRYAVRDLDAITAPSS